MRGRALQAGCLYAGRSCKGGRGRRPGALDHRSSGALPGRHRYLEYCLAHEPRPAYFKGTCLFDRLREDTPRRMRSLAERWPKRIVALRIHEMSMTPETGGPIRNRDMKDPA